MILSMFDVHCSPLSLPAAGVIYVCGSAQVDALINASLAKLKEGAKAGVEEHAAYLPGQRHKEYADEKYEPDED